MPVFVVGPLGTRLCEALGLDPGKVTDITLDFPCAGIATATVTFQPTFDEADKLIEIVGQFELQERTDG